jgi:hypothetical protein
VARDNLTGEVITAITSSAVRLAFLLQLNFADNTYYLWNGSGIIVWNGNNYSGAGTVGTIGGISESNTVQAQGISLGLSGIDPGDLAESMNEINHAGPAWVYLAFFDSNGNILTNPVPAYMGILDKPDIDLDTNTCSITIDVENRLADLNRSRGGRYTDQDQRARYPNDRSLNWVSYNQDRNIIWNT